MKKIISLFCAIIILLMVGLPVMAGPWHWGGGERIVAKDEVVKGDLIFQGERLQIDGRVEGDLMVAAGVVVINGQVDGTVLGLISQKLTVNGSIGQNLRALAGDVVINGKVNGNFTGVALTYKAGTASTVGGVLGTFNQWTSMGLIDGPVDITGQLPAQFGGQIRGDVKIQGSPPQWLSPLEIDGNVSDYTSSSNRPQNKGIVIKGDYTHPAEPPTQSGIVAKSVFIVKIIWFIGSLLISLIFFRLFPRSAWQMTEPNGRNFRRSLIIGFLAMIGFLVAMGILLFTIVGIPLAVLLGLIFAMIILFANVPVYLWLGRMILPQLRPTLVILIGGLVVAAVSILPTPIEAICSLVLTCVGFGMIVGNIKLQVHEG